MSPLIKERISQLPNNLAELNPLHAKEGGGEVILYYCTSALLHCLLTHRRFMDFHVLSDTFGVTRYAHFNTLDYLHVLA